MKKKLWKGKKTVAENVRRRLPQLASEYFDAGRSALAAGRNWDEMHEFRLQTKRFRYTLEIFRPAYGPGLEARIDLLRKIQTMLGDINDCIVTSRMLEQQPDSEEVRTRLAEKAAVGTRKLQTLWSERFDAPGECEQWMRYLRQYVRRTRCRPQAGTVAEVTAS